MQIAPELAATLVSGRAYADGREIDDAFRTIRATCPLARAQPDNYDAFWVVSRRADIMEIERQPDAFHAGDRASVVTPKQNEAMVRHLTGGEPNLVRSLVSVDGAEHRALRGIAFPAMVPGAVPSAQA